MQRTSKENVEGRTRVEGTERRWTTGFGCVSTLSVMQQLASVLVCQPGTWLDWDVLAGEKPSAPVGVWLRKHGS